MPEFDWQVKLTNQRLDKECYSFATLGGDATDAFEDVGHSTDARELMKDYLIGDVIEVLIQLTLQ